MRRKDGGVVIAEATIRRHVIDGRVLYQGFFRDVTERRASEDSVRASQRLLAHLAERFPNGSINVFDRELRYLMAAGRGLEDVGMTPDRLVGRTLAEFFPPEQVDAVAGPYRRAFAGEDVVADLALGDRTYALSVAPLEVVDGEVRTIVVVAQDITERVRIEEALVRREAQLAEAHAALQEAHAQLGERARLEGVALAARELAHLLQNDLMVPVGQVDMLRDEPSLPPLVAQSLATIAAGMDAAAWHIEQFQQVLRVTIKDTPVGPSLDLDRSTRRDSHST